MKKPATPAQAYCSQVCLEAEEPLAGTAVRVDVWIMLEYRRAWQAKALNNNTLEAATNSWIEKTVAAFAEQGLVARPQLIRRPQRSDGMALFVARDGQLSGIVVEDEQGLQKLDLLNNTLPAVPGPQYFVCTNAKRDLCCAKFGRPTFAALHKLVPDRVWQTTHVGGHRYAPNVLALPQAELYGRVMASDVPEFLTATEHHRVAVEFLRGNTSYSKIAQSAEHRLLSQNPVATNTASISNPETLKLIRETENSATFSSAKGVTEVSVLPDNKPLRVMPSCGKPQELIYPLVARVRELED